MAIRAIAGTAVAAGLVLMSCSDDDSGGGLGEGDDYSVAGALAELPASLDSGDVVVATGDLNVASEVAGLDRPSDASDVRAVMDWINPLRGGARTDAARAAYVPVAMGLDPPGVTDLPRFHDELGWSLVDAGSFVESSALPALFTVVSGPYDDETLSEDLIELDDGILTNKEGEDQEHDRENTSAIDAFGRPLRLAQDGDRIASSFDTPLVEEWGDGPDETLADDEGLLAVAEVLDEADVFSAYLARRGSKYSSSALVENTAQGRDDVAEALGKRLEDMELPPAPFGTVGIGWGAGDEGAVITVAYQHESDDAASDNAAVLEEHLTQWTSFQSDRQLSDLYDVVEVETDATIVVITLRSGPGGWPSTIVEALQAHDFPFVYD